MIDNARLDLIIAEHRQTLLFVLVAIGVLGLVGTGWVVANPSTSTTTQEVGSERLSTEAPTSAVVVEDGLWEEGTVLEDSPVYLYAATPEVTVTPETSVPDEDTDVTHEVVIHHEADRDGSVFWDETVLLSREDASIEGDVARTETTFELAEVRDRRAEIRDDLTGVGSISTSIEVTAEYDTGENAGEHQLSSSIELGEDAYWFDDDLSDSSDYSETTTIEVQESPNSMVLGGLLLLAVLSFGGAALVRSRDSIDVESARRAVHEQRYAEWISRGSIPMWVGDYHVELDTLEDVVDVAIDTNQRVVHDRQRSLFAVVNGSIVYYYSERGEWEGTAWPKMEFGSRSSSVPSLDSGQSAIDADDLLDLDDDVPDPTDDPTGPPTDDLPDPEDEDAWEQI